MLTQCPHTNMQARPWNSLTHWGEGPDSTMDGTLASHPGARGLILSAFPRNFLLFMLLRFTNSISLLSQWTVEKLNS